MVAEILQARAGPVRQQPSSRQSHVRLRLSPASTRPLAQGLRGAGDKRGSAPEDFAGKRAEASQTLMEMIGAILHFQFTCLPSPISKECFICLSARGHLRILNASRSQLSTETSRSPPFNPHR